MNSATPRLPHFDYEYVGTFGVCFKILQRMVWIAMYTFTENPLTIRARSLRLVVDKSR